jgi:hypothetical protein
MEDEFDRLRAEKHFSSRTGAQLGQAALGRVFAKILITRSKMRRLALMMA